jgi:hypothetical protein
VIWVYIFKDRLVLSACLFAFNEGVLVYLGICNKI